MSNKLSQLTIVGVLGLAISGCATTPEPSENMQALQSQYQIAEKEKYIQEYAPLAFDDAKKIIEDVKKMEDGRYDRKLIEHKVYLAQKKLDTAIEIAKQKRAEENIGNAALNRKNVLLESKSKKLETAEEKAKLMSKRAEAAEQEAKKARLEAKKMSAKAQEMVATLEDISASDTERLVITMGSILFEVNSAELKADAVKTVARIADFLSEYPERDVLIEGFTDSSGSESYNQKLSERRAKTVFSLLESNGISQNNLRAIGYGERFPADSNDTKVGRQKNRRVELVVAHSDSKPVSPRDR